MAPACAAAAGSLWAATRKFACVDGPEFDAHQVDFDLFTLRNRAYMTEEKLVLERHECAIGLNQYALFAANHRDRIHAYRARRRHETP